MNTINNKKKLLMNTSSIEIDALDEKISKLGSILTILFLSFIIIIFSALIFNIASEMYHSKDYTVTYTEPSPVQEPQVLTVGL